MKSKPTVRLIGQDGNAFSVLGACVKSASKAGWTAEQIQSFQDEAMSGDYDNVLQTALKYFSVG